MPEEKSKLEETYKQATEPIKFTADEMKEVSDMKDTYSRVQIQFGQAAITKIKLEEEIDNLNDYVGTLRKQFVETQKKEMKFLDDVKEKYGDGELNPETGIFTPFTEESK